MRIAVNYGATVRFLLLLCSLCVPVRASALNIELEPIIVGKETATAKEFATFEASEIAHIPINSPEELVDYFPSVDLQKRGSFGIQADVSIRGSVFEDNRIYINKILINDPQTGHFNLEIPFTDEDIERVQLDAMGKSIYFAIKRPQDRGFVLESVVGEHALREELVSFNFPILTTKNRLSYEYKTSSGARQDTDFEIYNLSFDSLWEKDGHEAEFIFAMTERDFGAANFYSSSFPREEEHTTQRLFMVRTEHDASVFSLVNNIYFKRHTDRFILDRHNPPMFTNHHTSYIYGLGSEILFTNNIVLGFGAGREKITSTNLGRRTRQKEEVSLGFSSDESDAVLLKMLFTETHYDDFEWLEKVNVSIGRKFNDDLKAAFLFSYDWRLPSFTELYLVQPTNIGNAGLDVQEDFRFELNTDYRFLKNASLHAAVFFRHQFDTIDWISNVSPAVWQAMNVGRVKAQGADCNLVINLQHTLREISLGYSYLDLDRDNPYRFSKYVFDYIRHKVVMQLSSVIHGASIHFIATYNKPINRGDYFIGDVKVDRALNENVTIFLEGTNIFNTNYNELQWIQGDGRWYKIGVEIRF